MFSAWEPPGYSGQVVHWGNFHMAQQPSGSGRGGRGSGGGNPAPSQPTQPSAPSITPQQRQRLVILDVIQEIRRNPSFGAVVADVLNGNGINNANLSPAQVNLLGKVSAEMSSDASFAALAQAELNGPALPAVQPRPAAPPSTGSSGGTAPSAPPNSSSSTTTPPAPKVPGTWQVQPKMLAVAFLITVVATFAATQFGWPAKVEYIDRIPAELGETKKALATAQQARTEDQQRFQRELSAVDTRHNTTVAALNSTVDSLRASYNRAMVLDNVAAVMAADNQRDAALAKLAEAQATIAGLNSAHALAIRRISAEAEAELIELRRDHSAEIAAVRSDCTVRLQQRDERIYALSRENEILSNRSGGQRVGATVTLGVICPNVPLDDQFEVLLEGAGEPIRFSVTVHDDSRPDGLEVQRTIEVPSDCYRVTRLVNGRPIGQPFPADLRPGQRTRYVRINEGDWVERTVSHPFLMMANGNVQFSRTMPENGKVVLASGETVTVENGSIVSRERTVASAR